MHGTDEPDELDGSLPPVIQQNKADKEIQITLTIWKQLYLRKSLESKLTFRKLSFLQ